MLLEILCDGGMLTPKCKITKASYAVQENGSLLAHCAHIVGEKGHSLVTFMPLATEHTELISEIAVSGVTLTRKHNFVTI